MQANPEQSNNTFLQFMWNNKTNRVFLCVAIVLSITVWIIFKRFYPYPNIIWDSYFYIQAAMAGAGLGPWPIGYSLFIRAVGFIAHAPNLLLSLQYITLQLALMFFFFSVRYFFHIGKIASILLFSFLMFNPIYLFISNQVLSDALFAALSLMWVTQLLWIVFKPRPYMIVTHAILLLLSFAVRYNALYYPIVAAVGFLLSRQKMAFVWSGIILQVLLVGVFMFSTAKKMEVDFKVKQFSPFSSWKLANNALYIYENVYQDNKGPLPPQFEALDSLVQHYFNGRHNKVDMLTNDPTWGSYYMWIDFTPLMQHMSNMYGEDKTSFNFRKYQAVAPLYSEYGRYIIQKHPAAFAQYFVMPNIQRYFIPPQEVLADTTNPFFLRKDSIGQPAVKWFGLKTISVSKPRVQFRTMLFSFYPTMSALIHFVFLLSGVGWLLLAGLQKPRPPFFNGIVIIAALWIIDFGFSILSAAIVLRYQVVMLTIEFAFAAFFIESLYQLSKKEALQLRGSV